MYTLVIKNTRHLSKKKYMKRLNSQGPDERAGGGGSMLRPARQRGGMLRSKCSPSFNQHLLLLMRKSYCDAMEEVNNR